MPEEKKIEKSRKTKEKSQNILADEKKISEVKARNIGLKAAPPEAKCDDKNCPYHGSLKIRGRTFVGNVTSTKAKKTATIRWTRLALIRKYERYEKRRTKVYAHNPACVDAKEGDEALIAECRPLSKTKNFVIIAVTKKM